MNVAILLFSLTLSFSVAWANNEEVIAENKNESLDNILGSDSSHTYVRCWYRLDNTHNDPDTDFKWSKKENSDDYYTIEGYWRHQLSGQNMFYTRTSQDEIKQKCVDTLALSNNEVVDISFFAADGKQSFNQTIWTQDSAEQPSKINKVVAFGDSLSDTGNIFNASEWRIPNPDSWFLGHFSNGFVWTEYLASALNISLYNWSVGGAAGIKEYKVLPGIGDQVTSYFYYMEKAENYQAKNTLFTFEIGLNDFMNYGREVKDVSKNVADALKRLVDEGGAHNIVLFMLPDPTHAPQFKYETQEKIAEIRSKIDEFNVFIKKQAQFYQDKDLNLFVLDVHSLFEQIIAHPEEYGLINVKDACLDINRSSSIDYLESHSLTTECASSGADKYLFWGITHPTTVVHKIFADKIIETGIFSSN